MKHLTLLLTTALAGAALITGIPAAHAVPALPRPIVFTQSDGTQLTIRIIGDEHRHYALSQEGYSLTGGPGGDLYFAALSPSGTLVPTEVRARPVNQLTSAEKNRVAKLVKGIRPTAPSRLRAFGGTAAKAPATRAGNSMTPPGRFIETKTTGKLKSLIILMELPDRKFRSSSVRQDFQNLLMQDGYSANGATGSAWNYYQDNSMKQFDPDFTVVGPYKAAHNSAYYAGVSGSENVPELIVEACKQASQAGVNFTEYADNGVIRDIFVFYSGINQAESYDTDAIWPHRWDVRGDSRYQYQAFNGVQLQGYACSSELNYLGRMTGIGTFCHEFGHVLGWPDFYDTDFDGEGTAASGTENFSLMCSGSYNNEGRTPPSLNILERWMADWATPEEITTGGDRTLDPISDNKGYLVRTPTENDYFLLEYRNPQHCKWDKYISSSSTLQGMLAYHVDYTKNYQKLWYDKAAPNVDETHECMKLVRSVPMTSNSPSQTFFPGAKNVTTLSNTSNRDYKSWADEAPNVTFSDMRIENGKFRLTARVPNNAAVRIADDGSVSIGIPDEGFSHAAPLALTLSDASGNVSDVAWQVDGKAVGANPKLPAGEHALTAVVTDAGDNSTRYIVKYITVK